MPNFRFTYVFSQPNKGWTEVYYGTSTSIATASTPNPTLWTSMIAFRAGLTVLNKVRVADVVGNRSATVVPINMTSPLSTANIELAGDSAVCNLVAPSTGATRRLWLRGMRQIDMARVTAGGVDSISGFLSSSIGTLLQNLVLSNYTVRSLQKIGVGNNVYHGITNVAVVAGSGQAVITFQGLPNPNVGDRIIISQINPKLIPGLNGHYKVLAQAGSTLTVNYNSSGGINLPVAKGRWRPELYDFGGIQFPPSGWDHLATRTTGKNSLGGRGRRRALVTRLA